MSLFFTPFQHLGKKISGKKDAIFVGKITGNKINPYPFNPYPATPSDISPALLIALISFHHHPGTHLIKQYECRTQPVSL